MESGPRAATSAARSRSESVSHSQMRCSCLSKGIDPLVAASAPDNISDAWRAVVPPLEGRPGGKVLILAGPGANSIPLYAVQIARAAGAGAVEVLTRNEQLAPQAERLGAEVALVEEWPEAHGRFDVVVENANERRGLGCALRSTRTGGHCTVTSLHSGGEAQIPDLRDVPANHHARRRASEQPRHPAAGAGADRRRFDRPRAGDQRDCKLGPGAGGAPRLHDEARRRAAQLRAAARSREHVHTGAQPTPPTGGPMA